MLTDIVASHRLHKAGLNVRHLGRVRAASTDPDVRKLILSACVARVMKQQLCAELRNLVNLFVSLAFDFCFLVANTLLRCVFSVFSLLI